MQFDLVILGDTPDAWAAAQEAARLGRRTAVLRPDIDGRGVASGVAAVLAAFGEEAQVPSTRSSGPRLLWEQAVRSHEAHIAELARDLSIKSWRGPVRLTSPNSAEVFVDGVGLELEAELLLIAVGTEAHRPRGLSLDRQSIFLPEEVPLIDDTPGHVVVLGGNRTALTYGTLFRAAGSTVTQIDAANDGLLSHAAPVLLGDVLDLQRSADGVSLRMNDGEMIRADLVLFAAGRVGATASLGLAAAGLEPDDHGRLWCDESGRTWVSSIFATGEVVGFPHTLRVDASIARRLVADHFGGSSVGRLDRPSVRRVPIPHSLKKTPNDKRFSTPSIRPLLRVFNG